ncbi:MAG: GFA family protein [Candidatus Pelagadaptatus aseana]|uniref:GFA family protein n=1 Tax=Candidatus Pelagadaptatus aseana TaxID=3120508 RepID=UPI0039B362B4
MIKGSCLCGNVKYQYTGTIEEVAICHCDQCKRAQGTPFATNSPIKKSLFSFQSGENSLKAFFSSEKKKRVFCGNCGSPLYSQRLDMPEVIRLRLGTVTEGNIPKPHYEIYGESKSDWYCEDNARQIFIQNKA